MIPISVLLAVFRSTAELSGAEGLHGAMPAHPSVGRKLRGRQPSEQVPSCPSQGESKASSAPPQAVPCLSLLSAGLELFIHQSPASLQKGCN